MTSSHSHTNIVTSLHAHKLAHLHTSEIYKHPYIFETCKINSLQADRSLIIPLANNLIHSLIATKSAAICPYCLVQCVCFIIGQYYLAVSKSRLCVMKIDYLLYLYTRVQVQR